jgi:phage-related protein
VAAWLRGDGVLVLGDMPTRSYKARCSNQIDLTKVMRSLETREFNAVFRCFPFRYTYPEPAALTYLPLVNKISNGNFSGGTTGWTATNATHSVSGGESTMLASASGGQVGQSIAGGTVIGRKYYFSANIKASSPSVRLLCGGTLAGHSGSNAYEHISGVHVATSTGHGVYVVDYRASGWNNVQFDNVLVIDLTAAFGAGNEPTAAQMDAYLADRYPNSWFNGTTTGGQIVNPGTVDAIPLITVVGSGDIDLNIGGRTIHIAGLATSITIDPETGFAKEGSGGDLSADLTSKVTMGYPWVLPPGTSTISWTGTVTSVTITRPWRYI